MAILLKHGMPYDEILRMSAPRRMAFIVTFGEMEGLGKFDWVQEKWEKPEQ